MKGWIEEVKGNVEVEGEEVEVAKELYVEETVGGG